MTRRVSVAIQAHPDREGMATDLASRLDAEPVFDPDPRGCRSAWRCYRACLEATPGDVTHRVVIQEDAIPCINFRAAIDRIVAARPDRLIALYVGGNAQWARQPFMAACEYDEPFAKLPIGHWVPAVGLVWPVELIAPSLAFVDAQKWKPTFGADDEIIGRCMTHIRHQGVMTVPSLLDHREDATSVNRAKLHRHPGGIDPGRVALCFIDGDPLDIDW